MIEEFGTPPSVPEGPLSEALNSAVTVAFVDSIVHSSWGEEQTSALEEIVKSKDPRIAWIISDLMRFVTGPELHALLGHAAFKILIYRYME